MARMVAKTWPVDHTKLLDVLQELEKSEKFGKGIGKFDGYSMTDLRKVAEFVAGMCDMGELVAQLIGGTGAHFTRPENGYNEDDVENEATPRRSMRR